MWLILQQDHPDDFVCATGVSHTVRELCEYVFAKLDMQYDKYVIQDEKFFRPEELNVLRGDATKIRNIGWEPKYTFEKMLDEMIEYWNMIYLTK
jgi:GDPmannose 4,6-dehydratase